MEIIVGVLLLTKRFVPLALVLLGAIVVGIVNFHIAIAPASIVPAIVVLLMGLYYAWAFGSLQTLRPSAAFTQVSGDWTSKSL